MAVREGPPEPPPPAANEPPPAPADEPRPYPAEKARAGRIVLRTPLQRFIFIGGLVALFVIVVILWWIV